MIFVCSYGCVVGPLKTGLYKLNGQSGRRHARRTYFTSVRTHKNQSFSSHRPSNGKKYVFRDPRDDI